LLRTGLVAIAVFMSRLLTGNAGWFNKKYRRHGPLFPESIQIDFVSGRSLSQGTGALYPLEPIEGEAGTEHDGDPWCGHGVLMNKTQQAWQNIEYVLGLFSNRKGEARKRYRAFVAKGILEGRRPDLVGGGLRRSSSGWMGVGVLRKAGIRVKGGERVLGYSDFVANVLSRAKEALEEK
jgi:hypothetical protein